MDDTILDCLFSGDLERLVELPKRVVRLFISSTFTDMTLERNSLMERVYPRLKQYCRESHGLDFQVVDMRWGVRDEATDDHQTVNLCSREIRNCQRMSLGPTFVALLGDKYGFRPLCNRIKSTEYRALRRCLIELDINTDFLDTWYKEDLNAVPAEYLLQPISSILKNFTNKSEPELQSIDQRIWQAIQERLHELLMIGSSRLVKQGRMSEQEQLMKYSISVTEREVIEGCLELNDAKEHCLVYVRQITNLQEHSERCLSSLATGLSTNAQEVSTLSPDVSNRVVGKSDEEKRSSNKRRRDSQQRKASLKIGNDTISLTTSVAQTAAQRKIEKTRKLIGKYIDLISRETVWSIDKEAQLALKELREIKLESKLRLSRKNFVKFSILWNEVEGVSLKSDEHKRYISELTDHFYTNLTRMIRRASRNEKALSKSGLIGEILQHSHYAKHVSRTFHGRLEELERIRLYILSSSRAPMFIYGVGGSGKTSTLARTATLARDWILSFKGLQVGSRATENRWDQKPCIIMRFCGTTPHSSTMVGVLTSVCRQLQFHFYQYGPLNGAMNQNLLSKDDTNVDNIGNQTDDSQLAYQPIPEDFVRLVFIFRKLLDNCQHHFHSRRTFLIILDSLERLSSPAESSVEVKYSWLTSIAKLPPNVRLIVSCSSEKTTESWHLDYRHLKRHFIQFYSKIGGSGLMVAQQRSTGSMNHQERQPREPNQAVADERQLAVDKFERLKKILIPAIRMSKRGSQQQETISGSIGSAQPIGWSLLSPSTRRIGNPQWRFSSHKRKESNLAEETTVSNAEQVSSRKSSSEQSDKSTGNADHLVDSRGPWILHIRPLGVELALSVTKRWLADVGRNLTHQQWSIVEKSFAHCSRPIFVKLALGEIVNWKSYSIQSDTKGLTFGSSLLSDQQIIGGCEWLQSNSSPKSIIDETLRKLAMDVEEVSSGGVGEEQFKRQILTMEQQWLNYLDYRQREEQKLSSERSSDSDNTVIIRVGATIGGTKSSSSAASKPAAAGASASPSSGSICYLSNTIHDAICQLFARIELQHGYVLTKHSLSYISAARNGICENELEDLLSLDDVVLDDVFQYHLPPVRRIPPLLWTRIRSDLPDYLSERDADGIVINWHHSQFKQVTRSRYLSESNQLFYIHSNMADYFLGTWADKPKPFRCTKQQIQMAAEQLESAVQQSLRDSQSFGGGGSGGSTGGTGSNSGGVGSISGGQRRSIYSGRFSNGSMGVRAASFGGNRLRSSQYDQRLQLMQAKADRRVPHQPLYYTTGSPRTVATDGLSTNKVDVNSEERDSTQQRELKRRYNLRKLTELPHHLMCSSRFLDLANHVIFNYKWLFAALEALGLQCVLSDFSEAHQSLSKALEDLETGADSGDKQVKRDSLTIEQQELMRGSGSGMLQRNVMEELGADELKSMLRQLEVLNDTVRLSCSAIHSDTQMLAPQLIGRLLPLVRGGGLAQENTSGQQQQVSDMKYLNQLLEQCDKDGAADCALLPIGHCLQSPDGLQLSSLEGHSFAIMAMCMGADQRHLLAVSNKFIMWDITTGQVSRDIDPKIEGSIMRQLRMGVNNEYALAYTSDNLVLVLDILTQQVSRWPLPAPASGCPLLPIIGLELIDRMKATRFVVWTTANWYVLRVINNELNEGDDDCEDSDGESAGETTKGFAVQRITVHLEYSMSLNDLSESTTATAAELTREILRVHCSAIGEGGTDLALLEVLEGGVLELITVDCRRQMLLTSTCNDGCISESNSGWICKLWDKQINSITALALTPDSRLLVYVSSKTGDLFLCRRRNTCWSKAKLLWRSTGAESQSITQLTNMKQHQLVELDVSQVVPLAVELDLSEDISASSMISEGQKDNVYNLTLFERQCDSLRENDEIEENKVFDELPEDLQCERHRRNRRRRSIPSIGIRSIKLYLSDRIVVLKLPSMEERSLCLPKNIRNISVQPNKCQIRCIIVGADTDEEYLVAAVGRRLLLYSLTNEQFLKSIEAHNGRIVQLIPVLSSSVSASEDSSGTNSSGDSRGSLSIASASLDKSVKIWDLSKVDRQVHSLDRLSSAIESLKVCPHRPLAACLSRNGELGLWDWRSLKLLARLSAASNTTENQPTDNLTKVVDSRIVLCQFSANGRYLCVASLRTVKLYSLDVGQRLMSEQQLTFNQQLPEEGTVRWLKFFNQDSRLLLVLVCRRIAKPAPKRQPLNGQEETFSETSSSVSGSRPTTTEWHLARRLLIVCLSVPDGRVVYTFESLTPHIGATLGGDVTGATTSAVGQLGTNSGADGTSSNSPANLGGYGNASGALRLPAMTRDQQHLVAVEWGDLTRWAATAAAAGASGGRRKSSALLRPPVLLRVYSTRDAQLEHSIDLSHLESVYSGNPSASSSEQQQQLQRRNSGNAKQLPVATSLLSISGEQFTKIKAVPYLERQTVVALLPPSSTETDCSLPSYLIDVQARQLLAISSVWNGKTSSDGRFGLSRMFKTSTTALQQQRQRRSNGVQQQRQQETTTFGLSANAADMSAGGLQLLEMRRCQPIKSLLSGQTLARLLASSSPVSGSGSGSGGGSGDQNTGGGGGGGGGDSDIKCGFTKPNDAYVYFHDARLARLLLLRLNASSADGQQLLIANYKLSANVSAKIKCAADGHALLLGQSDGSLTSLAVVDVQRNETLTQLAQYPSRRVPKSMPTGGAV